MTLPNALMLGGLTFAGGLLWILHAHAWSLGVRSPVLNEDTARVALAARELAQHGRLGGTFALPIELVGHPTPPWPLALVEPGMVGVEGLALRLLPDPVHRKGIHVGRWSRPDQREWFLLPFPFMCFIMTGTSLGLAVRHLLAKLAPGVSDGLRSAAGLLVGLAFVLDPEAQHLAMSPFPEPALAFGLTGAAAALALGRAGERPLLFGLLVGLTSSFATREPWIPAVLLAAVTLAAPARRVRVLALAALGFILPMAPWWIHQGALGSPDRSLVRMAMWDGIGGRTSFAMAHLPEAPDLPSGAAALAALGAKVARRLPGLLLAVLSGPRALWITSLVAWLALARPARPVAVAGIAVLALAGAGLAGAALGLPGSHAAFPVRVPLEAGGLLATLALVARGAASGLGPTARRAILAGVVVLALGWGGVQTALGWREARAAARIDASPGVLLELEIAALMNRDIPAGEPVMSNLGPQFAWIARRPVIHLALHPEDIEACRQRAEFRYVVLAFRDPARVWPGWTDLFEHPVEAARDPALHIRRTRLYRSSDGFQVVWLELAPPEPRLAAAG
jgi:hypothetical protein